jgi:hypothetical protein
MIQKDDIDMAVIATEGITALSRCHCGWKRKEG